MKSLTRLACIVDAGSEGNLPPEVLRGRESRKRAIAFAASVVHDQGASEVRAAALAKTDLLGSAETRARFLALAEVGSAVVEPCWATTSRREFG